VLPQREDTERMMELAITTESHDGVRHTCRSTGFYRLIILMDLKKLGKVKFEFL
jgi:hypothetical protein